MPEYLSQEHQRETYHEWRDYLQRFPWEWHCTFTFEDGIKYFSALITFDRWRLRLIDREKIQIGGYLFSASRRRHIHFRVLMFGQNRYGKSLRPRGLA